MPLELPNIGGLFKKGLEGFLKGGADIVDKFVQTKDEKAAMNLELQKLAESHFQSVQAAATREIELAYQDTASARSRESDFVKSVGHIDWMMTAVGILVLLTFIGTVYFVATQKMPEGSEHLLINAMGILEGLVLSVVGYYFGSSAGSRVKDMRK